jgi:hypothetical protein
MYCFVNNRKINHMRPGEIIPMWRPSRILYIVDFLERDAIFDGRLFGGDRALFRASGLGGEPTRQGEGEFDRHAAPPKASKFGIF